MTFGEQMQSLREAANKTQSGLAAELGVDRRLVFSWENGACRPTIDKLPAIASALKVSADTLLRVYEQPHFNPTTAAATVAENERQAS